MAEKLLHSMSRFTEKNEVLLAHEKTAYIVDIGSNYADSTRHCTTLHNNLQLKDDSQRYAFIRRWLNHPMNLLHV